jgi:formate dehydrogenase alpha subunit
MLNPGVASGLFDHFNDFPMNLSFREMRQGNLFVFIGAEGSNENPVASNHIRRAIIDHGAEVAIAYSKEVRFLPAPKMQLPYEYAGMRQFTLELLLGAVRSVSGNGSFFEGMELPGEWVKKLEKAAAGAPGNVEQELKLKIVELVRLIREKGRPIYIVGMEAQRHPQGTSIVQNVVNLAKITGGKVMLYREYCNSQGAIDMGVAPNLLPGYINETRAGLTSDTGVLELMESGKAKVLIVIDEDVLNRYPDSLRLKNAMQNVEFVIVTDQFYTQTGMEADVILPTTAAASKTGTFTNLEGRIQKLNPAIERYGQARHVWDIFSELADRMGKGFSFENSGDVTRGIASEVPIYSTGGRLADFADYGKLRKDEPALRWTEPEPIRPVEVDKTFTLLPDHQLFALGLYTDFCPALRPLLGKPYADFHLQGKPFVGFNPADAERLGFSDGDTVTFRYDSGQWEGIVKISAQVIPATIRIPDEKDLHPSVKLVFKGGEIDCVSGEGLKERNA